jgi:hypothetical protein
MPGNKPMSRNKAVDAGRHVGGDAGEARTSSHVRFKSPAPAVDPQKPSTLPPPPFDSEAQVPEIEWWLDAHMGLAADLLCIEQLLEAVGGRSVPPSRPGESRGNGHVDTVRHLAAHVEAVRDALYELYCDAADERVASVFASGAPIEQHVRASYSWCASVVALLLGLTNGLRSSEGTDWASVKATYRTTEGRFAPPSESLREAISSLSVDYASPIEPLRNLPQHLDDLFTAAAALRETLAKRFS